LPKIAPHVPLALPVPLALGHAAEGYPFDWSVCTWLPGENADGTIDDLDQAAVDLATFVRGCAESTPPAHTRVPGTVEAGHSRNATSRFVGRSHSSATGSTALPPAAPGTSRSTPRHGTVGRSGCTATCCRATCSSSTSYALAHVLADGTSRTAQP
jgi:hypothetical protein